MATGRNERRHGIMWRLTVLLGVLALVLAACGGDDDSGGEGDTTGDATSGDDGSTETEPPDSGGLSGELKIGIILDLTGGPVGAVGEREREGVELAVKEAQDTGFLGENVEIATILEDTKSDKDQGPIAIRKLISQDQVSGIVGFSFTALALASAPIAQEEGVPTVAVGVSAPEVTEIGDHIFRVFPVYARLIPADGPRLLDLVDGSTAALILQTDSEASIPQHDAWVDTLAAEGYELVADEEVVTADTDYSAQATKIVEADPDVVILTVAAGLEGQVVNQLRQAGYDGQVVGGLSHGNVDVQELMGENGIGDLWLDPYFVRADGGRNPEFVKLFNDEYGKDPDLFNAVGYDAMWLFLNGVKAAGSFERADIAAGLQGLDDLQGAQGECTLSDIGDLQCQAKILRIAEDGSVELVS